MDIVRDVSPAPHGVDLSLPLDGNGVLPLRFASYMEVDLLYLILSVTSNL